MKKKLLISLGFILVCTIGLGTYTLFFKSVDFKCAYDGVVDISQLKQEDYNNLVKQNAYVFASKEKWDRFKKVYLADGQVPKIEYEKGQILLAYTDVVVPSGGPIYDISKIKRNFVSLDINLKQKGSITKIEYEAKISEGALKNSEYKNFMIYRIDAGKLVGFYTPKIKIVQ